MLNVQRIFEALIRNRENVSCNKVGAVCYGVVRFDFFS